MIQTKYTVRLAALVLSAGLVSCAKDEKTRDVYKAPPPVINQKGAQDLKTWDRRSDKSLDLQDSFDVSAGNPARLLVNVFCRDAKANYFEGFTFVPRAPIKIFQVLPPALITSDITNQKVDCSFELTLLNEVGSKHIYQIGSTSITDVTGAGVLLEKTGSDQKISLINSRKLEGLRVRYRNSGAAAAQVSCQDMTLPQLPFEQVVDLIHFNFTAPELKSGVYPEVLTHNPVQACRILIRQGGQIQQISPRFMVQLPQKPFAISVTPLSLNLDQRERTFLGHPTNAGQISITNPDRVGTRQIRVEKIGSAAVVQGIPSFYHVAQYTGPWAFAIPANAPGITTEDKGDHFRMKIPAGQTAVLTLQIRFPGPARCGGNIQTFKNIGLGAHAEFMEVGENLEPLEKFRAEMPRTVYGEFPAERLPTPSANPCGN